MNLTNFALKYKLVPDALIRNRIVRLCARRLADENPASEIIWKEKKRTFLDSSTSGPLALSTREANEQHYELPPAFFEQVMGRHRKYSSCYFERPRGRDESAYDYLTYGEETMLAKTCQSARLEDGQSVLELGCGWGSLTLYMARRFPNSRITAVSNSNSQRRYILQRAAEENLYNIEVITADINDFDTAGRYERIVSVEMFEHCRNYGELFRRLHGWLKDDGLLFIHVFAHHAMPYYFTVKDDSDWMSRYFFTNGTMPSSDLFITIAEPFFENELLENINGNHYRQTSELWLENLDNHTREAVPVLENTYGKENARLWLQYWRIFFMACAELFGYNDGSEWLVCHYRFKKKQG